MDFNKIHEQHDKFFDTHMSRIHSMQKVGMAFAVAVLLLVVGMGFYAIHAFSQPSKCPPAVVQPQ